MRYDEPMRKRFERQSGQVALIVLLIMGLTLIIAVSLASRTSEDVALTTKQAETTKVFSAAQSGAEQILTDVLTALRAGDPVPTEGIPSAELNDADVNVTVAESTAFAQPLDEGETYQVELGTVSGDVRIEWGDPTDCSNDAALLIARYYYDTFGDMQVEYTGYSPYDCTTYGALHPGDGFSEANVGSSERRSSVTISYNSDNQIVRIIPVYNSTSLYITGAADQLYTITASAVNKFGDNQESRVIQVTASGLQPPPFLDYAVYS